MRGCGGPRLTMRPYGEPVGSGGEDRQGLNEVERADD